MLGAPGATKQHENLLTKKTGCNFPGKQTLFKKKISGRPHQISPYIWLIRVETHVHSRTSHPQGIGYSGAKQVGLPKAVTWEVSGLIRE